MQKHALFSILILYKVLHTRWLYILSTSHLVGLPVSECHLINTNSKHGAHITHTTKKLEGNYQANSPWVQDPRLRQKKGCTLYQRKEHRASLNRENRTFRGINVVYIQT